MKTVKEWKELPEYVENLLNQVTPFKFIVLKAGAHLPEGVQVKLFQSKNGQQVVAVFYFEGCYYYSRTTGYGYNKVTSALNEVFAHLCVMPKHFSKSGNMWKYGKGGNLFVVPVREQKAFTKKVRK